MKYVMWVIKVVFIAFLGIQWINREVQYRKFEDRVFADDRLDDAERIEMIRRYREKREAYDSLIDSIKIPW